MDEIRYNPGMTYEGKAAQQNMPTTKVEALMDSIWDVVSDVEEEAKKGKRSVNWDMLVKGFRNLRNRTRNIVDDKDFDITYNSDPMVACDLIKKYLNKLQEVGLFKIGQEEVLL
jgi:hypothetical protein